MWNFHEIEGTGRLKKEKLRLTNVNYATISVWILPNRLYMCVFGVFLKNCLIFNMIYTRTVSLSLCCWFFILEGSYVKIKPCLTSIIYGLKMVSQHIYNKCINRIYLKKTYTSIHIRPKRKKKQRQIEIATVKGKKRMGNKEEIFLKCIIIIEWRQFFLDVNK